MIARCLARVMGMPPRELVGRATQAARRRAAFWSWRLAPPVWRRDALADVLDLEIPALARAAMLAAEGHATEAHRVLSSHFLWRPRSFVLAPAARDTVIRLVRARFPAAAVDAQRRSERAMAGSLDVLGYRNVSFADEMSGGRIDWHRDPIHDRRAPLVHWTRVPYLDPRIGDHKVIWELNRHQHWLLLGRAYWLTGDARHREAFMGQLGDWMEHNPPGTGINWASMLELGLRAISWVWALHFFLEDPDREERDATFPGRGRPWTVDLLLGLHAQLSQVERHLSTYFSPNTHLLGEALALYVAGQALPELRGAKRWANRGRTILIGEIDRQILADGGHAELSTHYHRYTLDFYLLALAVAQVTRDHAAITPFGQTVERLAQFARTLSDRRFQLPQLGDDDGGLLLPMCGSDARDAGASLAVAAALLQQPELSDGRPHEEVIWITGAAPALPVLTDRRTSARLAASGYIVSRTWRGDHLVMDVGRLGYLNGGHAHADALSLTLTVAGRPLLIDPGTGCYTVESDVRDRLRSTAAHNTVTVDRRSQSEPAGPFHWRSKAHASLGHWQFAGTFDYAEAWHDGYGPEGHRRHVLARAGCWLVVDWIGGGGTHHAAAHWHLDPAWRVLDLQQGRAQLRHPAGTVVWMLSSADAFTAHVAEANGLGWHAPAYGPLQPTTTLAATRHARAPFALVTAIVEGDDAPSLQLLESADRSDDGPLAFRLATPAWYEDVIVAGPDGRDVDGRPFGIEARGRLLCARTSAAGLRDVHVASGDGAIASASRPGKRLDPLPTPAAASMR